MTTEKNTLRGSCFCGLVEYEVPDAFEYSLYCHCSNCRRTTGAAAKPFAGLKSDNLAIVNGEDRIMRYGSSNNHDAHCERCGSLLYSLVRDGAYVHVTLGTVNRWSVHPAYRTYIRRIEGALGRNLRRSSAIRQLSFALIGERNRVT